MSVFWRFFASRFQAGRPPRRELRDGAALSLLLAIGLGIVDAFGTESPVLQPASPETTLRRYIGTWDEEVVWYRAAVKKPLKWKGNAQSELLGKYWLVSRHTADFLGMGYEASDILGYDAGEGRWISIWVDKTADQLVIMKGDLLTGGDLALQGEMRNRDTTEKEPFTRTDHWVDPDTVVVHWVRFALSGQVAEEFTVTQRLQSRTQATAPPPPR
jgi:hypothetical protein